MAARGSKEWPVGELATDGRVDDSGKKRLNASYFLGVLSLVAVHNAGRPYWARSASAPFNDFGSTIGNDAGLNLFHEFEPGIRQMVKGHTPRFAFKIGERITHDQNVKEVVPSPIMLRLDMSERSA